MSESGSKSGVERAQSLRSDLAALRIERGGAARATARGRRSGRGRLLVVAAGVAGVLLVGALLVYGRALPVVVARATLAAAGTDGAPPLLSGSGYVVTGDRYVSIGVRVPGRIERYFVEEGQSVRKGDPLVQLDDRDYRAAVVRSQAALDLARANLGLAEADLKRGEPLYRKGVLSQQDYDVLRNKAAVARATVAQIEAELEQARISLDYTTLRAPSEGVVLAKLKEVGEIAVPGGFSGSGDLVRLANLTDMRAEVDVNEADLARVRIGGRAEVTPDAYPEARYAASVVKLYPQIDRQKGTLKVEVRIVSPDQRLLPDMSARVSFLGDPLPAGQAPVATVLVPSAAVRGTGAERYVWVVAGGRATRTPVEVASGAGDRLRVTRGLAGGEAVVVGDPPTRDGQAVRIAAES